MKNVGSLGVAGGLGNKLLKARTPTSQLAKKKLKEEQKKRAEKRKAKAKAKATGKVAPVG